jgi:D-alanyl-D-alanine carboxypeptidase (penicillin-binding protein 5/6)
MLVPDCTLAFVRRLAVLAATLGVLVGSGAAGAAPPPVDAEAALVANGTTGEIIWGKSVRKTVSIASITKIMTALVTLENARLDEVVRVSRRAADVGEATVDLRAGERIPVRDLLEATLVESANDAANALADHVGGRGAVSRFVELMNARARELGLGDTRFRRADGLDTPGHVSSARDVFELARAAMERPKFREIVRLRRAKIAGNRTVETTNDLLARYRGLIGVKTGHTLAAGWSEVAAARRGNVIVYAVVLGGPSRERRNADLTRLLDWGFRQLGEVTLIEANRVYATAQVPYREDRPLVLVADRTVRRVVTWGEPLVERVRAPITVSLPVIAGDAVGRVEVVEPDTGLVVAEAELLAGDSVPAPSVRTRVGWYARKALGNVPDIVGAVLGAIW